MLRRELGAITIDRIIETEGPDPFFDPVGFFPKTTPDDWAEQIHRNFGWAIQSTSGRSPAGSTR